MENKGYPGGFTIEKQSPSQPPIASGGQIQPVEPQPYNPQNFLKININFLINSLYMDLKIMPTESMLQNVAQTL